MKKMLVAVLVLVVLNVFVLGDAFSNCGVCNAGKAHSHEHPSKEHPSKEHPSKEHPSKEHPSKEKASCFSEVCTIAEEKGGVKEITYEQFQKIRNSGEGYVLVDALSAESYAKGHIEGAISFPYDTININTAPGKLNKKDNIIVYCGSFKCGASTKAAHRLDALGYENVVDYKGGLGEWQEKGNALEI